MVPAFTTLVVYEVVGDVGATAKSICAVDNKIETPTVNLTKAEW